MIMMMIAWLILIILGIAALVKWMFGSQNEEASPDSAMDILRKRYARGEINKEEFENRRQKL